MRGETLKPGDKALVTVKGRDLDGYYELSMFKVERPMDWTALEKAFADKSSIVGTVTAVVKGGFSVDVGVRAFMPASRSGVRDAADMEKLVGQEIRCRIIKLDVTDEDVVVDRRAVAEEEERSAKDRLYSQMKEGDTVSGTVRSLADYGAFVDLGGVDALLHVGDISWTRVNKPADVLSVGQQLEVKDPQARQRRRQAPHFRRPEATAAASLGRRLREIHRRRPRARHRHAPHGVRRVRRTRARHRRPDSHLRDVVVERQSPQSQRRRQRRRDRRSHYPASESPRTPPLARTQASPRRSLGRSRAALPGRLAGRRTGHQPHQVRRLCAAFQIDIVFANAGVARYAALGAISEEFFDSIFNTNVKGVLFTVQKALPLLSDGASIVLNASMVGSKGLPAYSVYSATKAAVRSFARTWTTDLKERRIRVNAVSPGTIDTPAARDLLASSDVGEKRKKMIAENVPLGRFGTADESAKAVVFLASDDSSYVTGAELFVDGGFAQV